MKKFFLSSLIISAAFLTGPATLLAQTPGDVIVIAPLFDYPSAPDDLEDLTSRSDYVVSHFWAPMDFSQKAVDQNALNDAFNVYANAMPYARSKTVYTSIDALVARLKDNPTLTLQFAKAAEEKLFGPRAPLWSDEAYLPFLRAVDKCKGISDTRKLRYREQLRRLTATQAGRKAPNFRYRSASHGRYVDFKPEADYTLIIFGDPECEDCRFAKMKLSMASDLSDMVENKRAQILFIVPDVVPGEEDTVLEEIKTDLPEGWTAGVGFGIDDKYDLRSVPSIYLLGKGGSIMIKNADASMTLNRLREALSSQKDKNK